MKKSNFELTAGVPAIIENANALAMRFNLTTAGGTDIEFDVPVNAQIKITPGTDIVSSVITINDPPTIGPKLR